MVDYGSLTLTVIDGITIGFFYLICLDNQRRFEPRGTLVWLSSQSQSSCTRTTGGLAPVFSCLP